MSVLGRSRWRRLYIASGVTSECSRLRAASFPTGKSVLGHRHFVDGVTTGNGNGVNGGGGDGFERWVLFSTSTIRGDTAAGRSPDRPLVPNGYQRSSER
jgi:hypothetical protein